MLALLAAVAIVPFEVEDARLYVPVHAPGLGVEWFILDSGASSTILDSGVAGRLGLAVEDLGTQGGAGSGSTRIGRATGAPLSVGGVPFAPAEFRVFALDALLSPSGGRRAPGVIGAQFFGEHVLELDFGERVLRVFPPGTSLPGTAIPVELVGGTPLARGILELEGRKPLEARMLVDLGAKATALVAEPFMAHNRLRPEGPARPLGAGLGGETRYVFARVRRVALGDFGLRGAVAGFSAGGTLRADWYDVLLGLDYLSRFGVVFDLPRSRILLTARNPMPPPVEADMSGMFLVARGAALREYVVAWLAPGAPAAAAGVRVGDELMTIGGRPASSMTLSQVRDVLRGGDGRVVELEVRGAGAQVSARRRLRLRRLP